MLEAFRKAVLEREDLEIRTSKFFLPEAAVVSLCWMLEITLDRTQEPGRYV